MHASVIPCIPNCAHVKTAPPEGDAACWLGCLRGSGVGLVGLCSARDWHDTTQVERVRMVAILDEFHHLFGTALDADDTHALLVEWHRLTVVIEHLHDEERRLGDGR